MSLLGLPSSVSDPSNFDMDPDPDPWVHIWEKWIRILGSEYLFLIFVIYFNKEIHVGQITILIFVSAKIEKRHFSVKKKTFGFTFYFI